jgi:hypothetical protein
MGDVVNLNQARKERLRKDKAAAAKANRAKFGRTAAEKAQEKARAEQLQRGLDQAIREDRPKDIDPD